MLIKYARTTLSPAESRERERERERVERVESREPRENREKERCVAVLRAAPALERHSTFFARRIRMTPRPWCSWPKVWPTDCSRATATAAHDSWRATVHTWLAFPYHREHTHRPTPPRAQHPSQVVVDAPRDADGGGRNGGGGGAERFSQPHGARLKAATQGLAARTCAAHGAARKGTRCTTINKGAAARTCARAPRAFPPA